MDLNTLKQALAPLTKWGQEELSFEVEGVQVALRPLLPSEELECQKFAIKTLQEDLQQEGLGEEDQITRMSQMKYFDDYRAVVLSYAIVQIGDTNLRKEKSVETGEVVEGVRVRVPLHVAMRKIISESWSRGMIAIAFSKYGDLVTRIAEKADRIVKESVSDMDAEIQRVEARLKFLREEREKRAKGDPSITSSQIRMLVQAGEALEKEIDDAIQEVRDQREELDLEESPEEEIQPLPEPEVSPGPDLPEPEPEKVEKPAARKSVIPQRVPPPAGPQAGSSEAIRKAQEEALREDLGTHFPQAEAITGPDGSPIEAFELAPETISARGKGRVIPTNVNPDPRESSVNPRFVKPVRR